MLKSLAYTKILSHSCNYPTADPCAGIRCGAFEMCEAYSYSLGVTVAFHRCIPRPSSSTGVMYEVDLTEPSDYTTVSIL